jgi:hypothetical protein
VQFISVVLSAIAHVILADIAALQANDIAPVLKHNIYYATALSSRDIIDLTAKDEEPLEAPGFLSLHESKTLCFSVFIQRNHQISKQFSKTAGVKAEVKTEGTITLDPDIIDLTCLE